MTPSEIARRWPVDQPLTWLHSGRMHPRWARWSIMATPRAWFRFDGRSHLNGEPGERLAHVELSHDALRDLDALLAATSLDTKSLSPAPTPFRGGWIGYLSYDLGRVIEPRADHHRIERVGGWPLIELAWCPDALVFDTVTRTWAAIGERLPRLDEAREAAATETFGLDDFEAELGPSEYQSMVARTVEYIAAGDIFQANIAQRFRAAFDGSTRALAIDAFGHAQPWYGAYMETNAGRAIVSLSPELFLHSTPLTRRIVTRPIKGTRPSTDSVDALRSSAKDQAELNMIVDLMRNDLGRACEFGSVGVPQPRIIETHPTVHHGVAEITGRLREDARISNVLRATFPPGSVTGAPKIRAMQIIDELEACTDRASCAGRQTKRPAKPALHDHGRGPYCGAIGFFSDCGAMTLNVAIRTMLLEGTPEAGRVDRLNNGSASYSAGAGIVADSLPRQEYQETLDKAAVLRGLTAAIATARH